MYRRVWYNAGGLGCSLSHAGICSRAFTPLVLYQIDGKWEEHLFHIFTFFFSDVLGVAADTGECMC